MEPPRRVGLGWGMVRGWWGSSGDGRRAGGLAAEAAGCGAAGLLEAAEATEAAEAVATVVAAVVAVVAAATAAAQVVGVVRVDGVAPLVILLLGVVVGVFLAFLKLGHAQHRLFLRKLDGVGFLRVEGLLEDVPVLRDVPVGLEVEFVGEVIDFFGLALEGDVAGGPVAAGVGVEV